MSKTRQCLRAALTVVVAALLALVATTSQATETITYIHWDALGSPVAATDEAGNVVWREAYRPYGERINNEAASAGNSRWYTGHPQDADTGLVYAGARYYDPVVGRFLGMDSVGVLEGKPHSFNRYAYGSNSPYRYVDPDGRIGIDMDMKRLAVPKRRYNGARVSQSNYTAIRESFHVAFADNYQTVAAWRQYDSSTGVYNLMASVYTYDGWLTPVALDNRPEDVLGGEATPAVGIDDNGNAIAVWAQSDGTAVRIWAANFYPATGWTAPMVLDDGDVNASEVSFAMSTGGDAIVTWPRSNGTNALLDAIRNPTSMKKGIDVEFVGKGFAKAILKRIGKRAAKVPERAPDFLVSPRGTAFPVPRARLARRPSPIREARSRVARLLVAGAALTGKWKRCALWIQRPHVVGVPAIRMATSNMRMGLDKV